MGVRATPCYVIMCAPFSVPLLILSVVKSPGSKVLLPQCLSPLGNAQKLPAIQHKPSRLDTVLEYQCLDLGM